MEIQTSQSSELLAPPEAHAGLAGSPRHGLWKVFPASAPGSPMKALRGTLILKELHITAERLHSVPEASRPLYSAVGESAIGPSHVVELRKRVANTLHDGLAKSCSACAGTRSRQNCAVIPLSGGGGGGAAVLRNRAGSSSSSSPASDVVAITDLAPGFGQVKEGGACLSDTADAPPWSPVACFCEPDPPLG